MDWTSRGRDAPITISFALVVPTVYALLISEYVIPPATNTITLCFVSGGGLFFGHRGLALRNDAGAPPGAGTAPVAESRPLVVDGASRT